MTPEEQDGEGYAGPARVVLSGHGPEELAVRVDLRGRFEPLDGRFHWYGRVDAPDSDRLANTVMSGATVLVRTAYGEAVATLSDRDPWGRFRLTGEGRPPFWTG